MSLVWLVLAWSGLVWLGMVGCTRLLVAVDQLVFSAFVARTWSRLQKRQRMAGERGAKRGRKERKSRRLMVIDII